MLTLNSSLFPFIKPILDFSAWHPAGSTFVSTSRLPEHIAIIHKTYIESQVPLKSIIEIMSEDNLQNHNDGIKYCYLRIDTANITEPWLQAIPKMEKLFNLLLPRITDKVIPKGELLSYNHRKRKYDEASLNQKLEKTLKEAQHFRSIKAKTCADFLNPQYAPECNVVIATNTNKLINHEISGEMAHRINKADSAATQGTTRKYMEDYTLITHLKVKNGKSMVDVPLYAVFDGHVGNACAKYLSENLRTYLTYKLKNTLSDDSEGGFQDLYHVLKIACLELGRDFTDIHKYYVGGSTAVFAIIVNDSLWVTNVGDSRAILVINGKPIVLSQDATLELPKYQKQVQKRGQEVSTQFRVLGLNMARAIGHDELESGISSRGSITCNPLSKLTEGICHLILASDGLWDVATPEEVAIFVNKAVEDRLDTEQIAVRIIEQAIKAGSLDNISVVVVEIKRPMI